jgi:small-conductance mechanosensitive channel/CRP-like cAMP-binding protein
LPISTVQPPGWLTASHRIGWELAIIVLLLCVAVAVAVPLRHLIKRTRLIFPYMVFWLAISAYLAVMIVEPGRIGNSSDRFTWWFDRSVVAAMLFVAVRVIDRLIVIPMFTRGGTIQVPRFIHQVTLIVLSIFVVLMYGKVAFGWPISDFLTGGAVVSIVIGLALQESLGNLFSGLVLQADPPFVLGDFIQAGNLEGRVVDMTWRAVTLHTTDDNYVVIPNGSIAKQEIINFHAPTEATARMIKIGLEYDLPPCDAMGVLMRAAKETAGVHETPPIEVRVLEFADSSILYGVKFWITTPQKHQHIEHEVRMHAWYRLKERGYNIPFPIRTVEHVSLHRKLDRQHQAEISSRQETISKIPLLAPLSSDQHRKLAEGAKMLRLAPGQVLFTQDAPGESLYIIRRGKADILINTASGATSLVATLGVGDVIGEMSALTGQPRSATVRAAEPLSLVEIGKQDLQLLIDADPSILGKISELISSRNVQRDAHLKQVETTAANAETVQIQQQSLLGRMMAFFQKDNA